VFPPPRKTTKQATLGVSFLLGAYELFFSEYVRLGSQRAPMAAGVLSCGTLRAPPRLLQEHTEPQVGRQEGVLPRWALVGLPRVVGTALSCWSCRPGEPSQLSSSSWGSWWFAPSSSQMWEYLQLFLAGRCVPWLKLKVSVLLLIPPLHGLHCLCWLSLIPFANPACSTCFLAS